MGWEGGEAGRSKLIFSTNDFIMMRQRREEV